MSIVQRIERMDKEVFWLASLGDGDKDLALVRHTIPAGMFIPLHRHDDIECVHVTSGSVDVYAGDHGGWFTVGAGESIVVQPNEPHAIRNVTDRPADSLAIVTVRLATFISRLGTIAAEAGRERPLAERRRSLREVSDEYGYWVASDAESEAIRDLPAVNAGDDHGAVPALAARGQE